MLMTELSPAAQAVLDAAHDGANRVLFDIGDDSPVPMCVAAALRAAADQVVPLIDDPEFFCGNCCERVVKQEREETRAALLAIATELENAQ